MRYGASRRGSQLTLPLALTRTVLISLDQLPLTLAVIIHTHITWSTNPSPHGRLSTLPSKFPHVPSKCGKWEKLGTREKLVAFYVRKGHFDKLVGMDKVFFLGPSPPTVTEMLVTFFPPSSTPPRPQKM